MKKSFLFLVVMVLFLCSALAMAAEQDLGAPATTASSGEKLGITLDLTYVSKWMSKGGEVYGQQGAMFESITIDFWKTGWGVCVAHRSATGGQYANRQRLDYAVFYGNKLFAGEKIETKYRFQWVHKNYYTTKQHSASYDEWNFKFSWPKLLDCGIVPSYMLAYAYPSETGGANRRIRGFLHFFGAKYKWKTDMLPKPIVLSGEACYRDGFGGGVKTHDWSYATFGIATSFDIAENLTFNPGVYHQLSMDDAFCKRDVTWCKLNMKYKF